LRKRQPLEEIHHQLVKQQKREVFWQAVDIADIERERDEAGSFRWGTIRVSFFLLPGAAEGDEDRGKEF